MFVSERTVRTMASAWLASTAAVVRRRIWCESGDVAYRTVPCRAVPKDPQLCWSARLQLDQTVTLCSGYSCRTGRQRWNRSCRTRRRRNTVASAIEFRRTWQSSNPLRSISVRKTHRTNKSRTTDWHTDSPITILRKIKLHYGFFREQRVIPTCCRCLTTGWL